MNQRLEELKKQLRDDFGKLTCWQWLCKDQNATTEQEQIALAEQVLAMPRMDNVAAAHTYWLRLQGKKSADISDILSPRESPTHLTQSSEQAIDRNGANDERGGTESRDEEIRTA